MKQVWYVSPGAADTLVGHACQESVRLLQHRLTRGDRRALDAGRAVYKLETCPYCDRRRLLELYQRAPRSGRQPLVLLSGD